MECRPEGLQEKNQCCACDALSGKDIHSLYSLALQKWLVGCTLFLHISNHTKPDIQCQMYNSCFAYSLLVF